VSVPVRRANPSPEVTDPTCRIPLRTYAHRPEAAHLGDPLRFRYGCVAPCTALHRGPALLQRHTRPPRSPCFAPQQSAETTRIAGEGVSRQQPRPAPCTPRRRCNTQRRNLCRLPFRARSTAHLGPAHPPQCSSTGEPVSSPAFGIRLRIVATPTKIRTAGSSTHACACPSPEPARPPTPLGGGLGALLSAIHFRHSRVRQVRCNTLLSGCQPLWPPPCCPDSPTAFNPCAGLRPLILPSGSSRFATAAYQPQPTWDSQSRRTTPLVPPCQFAVCQSPRTFLHAWP